MAAIEFDSAVMGSEALHELARLLQVSHMTAFSHVAQLWMWVATNDPQDMSEISTPFLADICGYSGKPSILWCALLDSGFLYVSDVDVIPPRIVVTERYWRKAK